MPANTSVYNLSSQVLNLIDRIDKDLQIDRREVIDALRQGATKFLKQDNFMRMEQGQRFVDPHYVAHFTGIEIQKDEERFDRNYIDIPCLYVSLKDNEGVQRVLPATEDEDDYVEMIPVPNGAQELYRNLTVNDALIGVWTYSLQRDKIVFGRQDGETLLDAGIEQVDMDVVVISPLDVTDTDPFPLPPEFHFDLIQQVVELFARNPDRVRQVVTQEEVDRIRLQHEQVTTQLGE